MPENKGLALLHDYWTSGIVLSVNNDKLRFKAAPGVMTPALLESIKAKKIELMAALAANPTYFDARPLSMNERALWFMYRMDPESAAYNMAYAIKINSGVAKDTIVQAFTQLIKRHPILSGPYSEREGEPVQWLSQPSEPCIHLSYQQNATPASIKEHLSRAADKPLLLEVGEVCRAELLLNTTSNGVEPYLLMVIHHIAADFMSFEVLRQDFLQLINNIDSPLALSDYSYQDWSAQQQVSLGSQQDDKQYWIDTLEDIPQLQLPTDFLHGSTLRAQGEEISFTLDSAQAEKLRSACKALSVTPYVWWLSAFQWFMGRLSGQDDFVIGTPSAGRFTSNHARLVGYLVNPLALRCKTRADQPFNQWMSQTNTQIKQSMGHQRYPFSALIEALDVKREAGRSPVFQHMFTLNHERTEGLNDAIIDEELFAEQRGAAHELNLVVVDNRQQFTGKWRYNKGLYRRKTVDNIQAAFLYFVEQLLINDKMLIRDLHMTKPQGNVSLSPSLLQGETLIPAKESAWEAFVAQCKLNPKANAIQVSNSYTTYGQLLDKVNQWSEVLDSAFAQHQKSPDLLGNTAQHRVGICLHRSLEQIISMLACWKLGAAYVAMDPQWPEDRLAYVSDDANVAVVVGSTTRPSWVGTDHTWMNVSESLSAQLVLGHAEQTTTYTFEQPSAPTTPDKQTAYIIYTSGSTGKPKGVAISQRNIMYYTSAMMSRLDIPAQASLASLASSGADLGYTATFGALLTGRCLRLLGEALALDADALAEELTAHPVDCLKIVPSHLNGLLLAANNSNLLPREALITGGEALSRELLSKVWEHKPRIRIFNHYGPTETTVGALMLELKPDEYNTRENTEPTAIPLGLPLANMSALVLDDCGHEVIPGFAGELHIAGPTVAQGYLVKNTHQDKNSKKNTVVDSRFIRLENQRWYKTGDKVKIENGLLYFLGRCDFQVKIRGYRVEPGEVEAWLKQSVDDAIVVNCPSHTGQNRLLAYVVTQSEEVLAATQKAMKNALPEYMIPAVWLRLESLPLTSSGKVDRTQLPNPDEVTKTTDTIHTASNSEPRNRIEAELLAIWQTLLSNPKLGINDNFFEHGGDSILGLQIIAHAKRKNILLTPKDIFEHQNIAALSRIATSPYTELETTLVDIAREILKKPDLSATDNFFEVGGDSILSLQIIAKARSAGITISPKQIFEHQSMSALSEVVEYKKASVKAKERASLPTTAFPLTPIQHWFFEQNQPNAEHWNQSLLLNVNDALDVRALQLSISHLMQAHPSLRLSFEQKNNQWQQYYQAYEDHWIHLLYNIEQGEPSDEVLHKVQSSFDLSTGPLVKFTWFPKTQQLLCCAHHLIIDAVSWKVVLDDMQNVYRSHIKNEGGSSLQKNSAKVSVLSESPTLFHQWQQHLVEYTKTINIAEQTDYWLQQAQHELPENTSDNTYSKSQHFSTVLTKDATNALLSQCYSAYNTRIQELLLAPLVQAIGRWQQIDEVTIELEGHGREADSVVGDALQHTIDLSRSVGWFTSRYPQKLTVCNDLEAGLISVKEQLRRMPSKGLEYGLVRYLQASEKVWPSHNFLSFNYLGQQQTSQNSNDTFSLANGLCAGSRAGNNRRPHLIDINAMVIDGSLTIDWCYPKDNMAYQAVPTIAENYHQGLMKLIEHCVNPHHGRSTAADFLSAGLNDTQFLDLLEELDV